MKEIRVLFFILLLLIVNSCIAQKGCAVTLGDFYNSVKVITVDLNENLQYKTCASFDFKTFSQIDGPIDRKNFFEVGYNSKGEVRQIIHYDSNWYTMRFFVRHYSNFKIMLMQYHIVEYGFMPVAFFISDEIRFMVNFRVMTGKDQYQFGMLSDNTYIGPFEQISCIMLLDKDLYPSEYFIAHKGYIYTSTKVNYNQNSRVLKDLRTEIFFTPMERKGRKIDVSLCVADLYNLFGTADSYMTVQPLDYKKEYPLWIYGGSSSYR